MNFFFFSLVPVVAVVYKLWCNLLFFFIFPAVFFYSFQNVSVYLKWIQKCCYLNIFKMEMESLLKPQIKNNNIAVTECFLFVESKWRWFSLRINTFSSKLFSRIVVAVVGFILVN